MAKAVIYARVSTQGHDYERQLAELREYARKMEYEVVMEFSEKVCRRHCKNYLELL